MAPGRPETVLARSRQGKKGQTGRCRTPGKIAKVVVKVRYNYRLRVGKARDGPLGSGLQLLPLPLEPGLGPLGRAWREEGLAYSYADANKELTDWRGSYPWLLLWESGKIDKD